MADDDEYEVMTEDDEIRDDRAAVPDPLCLTFVDDEWPGAPEAIGEAHHFP